jgi:hypothetical protein
MRAKIDPDHLGATIARAMMPSGQPTWEPRPMPDYRVCFINEIPRNDKLFRCCQRSIIIQSAPTAEWAVEAAKKQFARLEGIKNWNIHAALIEIEPIVLEANRRSGLQTA